MDPGFITLMRKLAPDLIDEITRRALILERIAALQPVGRRQLAARLNLPEREVRAAAAYFAGKFNREQVTFGGNSALTTEPFEQELRKQGIWLTELQV